MNFIRGLALKRGPESIRKLYDIYRTGGRRWDPGIDVDHVVSVMAGILGE